MYGLVVITPAIEVLHMVFNTQYESPKGPICRLAPAVSSFAHLSHCTWTVYIGKPMCLGDMTRSLCHDHTSTTLLRTELLNVTIILTYFPRQWLGPISWLPCVVLHLIVGCPSRPWGSHCHLTPWMCDEETFNSFMLSSAP
jgi:hypothetical protein